MTLKSALRCFALLAVLATAVAASVPLPSECPPPCRRPQCQQQCGPQKPAFCTIDEFGCSICQCNG
jgi:hypothetical protein